MLTRLRDFLEDLLIQSVAFPFLGTDLYSEFTQSPFIFISEIHFLELKVCAKYLTETLKILTKRSFAEVF